MIEKLDKRFGKYIGNLNFYKKDRPIDSKLKRDFLKLLQEGQLDTRGKLWEDFNVNINSVSQIPAFANPYFLGFGNPKADILFIGKEKAFDIYKNPMSFFHESFNNSLQWKLIEEGKFDEKSIFDPRNPRKYYDKKIKSIHTWGKYAQIIAGAKNLNLKELLDEYSPGDDSLFNHCFMTEINHIPSRYSIGHNLIEERRTLLKDPFYKRFKNVIIGAKGYFDRSEIEDLFDVELFEKDKIIGSKGKLGKKKIKIDLYRNENQQVIYCQQLSGASGWTNKAIEKLAELVRNHIKNS